MQQLIKNDSELASSVVSNAGTRVCFRIGDTDAKRFEGNFSYFDAPDLQNLDTGQAIMRIERPDYDCNLDTIPYQELGPEIASENTDLVYSASRDSYGTPKSEVEAWLRSIQEIPERKESRTEEKYTEPIKLPTSRPDPRIPTKVPPIEEVFPETKHQETKHKYLQTFIKKMAESRGYRASIEEPTPDGKGRVDVSLERNGKKIAVEIKDTTDDQWELGNITKCLLAGYDLIIETSKDQKAIERLRKKVASEFNGKPSA